MIKLLCRLLPLLAVVPTVQAWGALGHMTVGYIAQNLVSPKTEAWAKHILKITNDSYLASVAPWADSYRETAAGRFTEPFHFVDAEDTPPTSCDISYSRDCGSKGCIISAIQNYTTRLQDTTLSSTSRKQALQFLVHFFGDLTQPLHNENVARGGNDYNVTFGHTTTNLHHIWDTNMLELLVGGYHLSNAEAWAANLTKEIHNGVYVNETAMWLSGMDLADPVGTAVAMSADANMFVCSYVLTPGLDFIRSEDLSGDYYQGAIPIFSRQVAKGGYRLAAWLDLIANAMSGIASEEYVIEDEL